MGSMDPEQGRLVQQAAKTAAAHLSGDISGRDGLIYVLGSNEEKSAQLAPKAFTFLGLAATELLSRVSNESVDQVLGRVPPRDALLLPGIPTAWQQALDLFRAVYRNSPDVDHISARMDFPSAMASTFSIAIAVIDELAISSGHSPTEVAMMFSEAIRDFFISYTAPDEQWAEWIAWELEQAGHTTVLQVWDFGAGSHFVTEMHSATQVAKRTIAVLSRQYLTSSYADAEWQEAWRADPTGALRKLLVFRVDPPGN